MTSTFLRDVAERLLFGEELSRVVEEPLATLRLGATCLVEDGRLTGAIAGLVRVFTLAEDDRTAVRLSVGFGGL